MGIHHLRSLITKSNTTIRNPTMFYFDFTSKFINLCIKVQRQLEASHIVFVSTSSKLEYIIDQLIVLMHETITRSVARYAKQSASVRTNVVFDFKYLCNVPHVFTFDPAILNQYKISSKEAKACTPMISKRAFKSLIQQCQLGTPTQKFLEEHVFNSVRNSYEIKWNYWRPSSIIKKYVTIDYLIRTIESCDDTTMKFVINVLQHCRNIAISRYIFLRGAKQLTRKSRRTKKNKMDINEIIYSSANNFAETIRSAQLDISHAMLISLLPRITAKFIRNYRNDVNAYNIKFYGCEFEAEYVINNSVRKQSDTRNTVVYTSDSDMIAVLGDIDCTVCLFDNGSKRYAYINPKQFWTSYIATEFKNNGIDIDISGQLQDVISLFVCILGTDYNEIGSKQYKICGISDMFQPSYPLYVPFSDSYYVDFTHNMSRILQSSENSCGGTSIRPRELLNTLIAMNIFKNGSNLENTVHELVYSDDSIYSKEFCEKIIDAYLSNAYTSGRLHSP